MHPWCYSLIFSFYCPDQEMERAFFTSGRLEFPDRQDVFFRPGPRRPGPFKPSNSSQLDTCSKRIPNSSNRLTSVRGKVQKGGGRGDT